MSLNVKNKTIFEGDNLDILRGFNSESVDLIYLDPPFNSNRTYSAPIGSEAAGASFKDAWTLDDVDEAWHGEVADREPGLYRVIDSAELSHGKGMKSYLIFMAVRLLEMKRVLKPEGSVYLHCDQTASHYLKLVMDAVFDSSNFRNEIVWQRTTNTGSSKSRAQKYSNDTDSILYYVKSRNNLFNKQYRPYSDDYLKRFKYEDERGKYRWQYMATYSEQKLEELKERDMVRWTGKNPEYKQYLHELKGIPLNNLWADIFHINPMAKERTGYPTQKPLALLERIIKASSNPGDMVLDPFCGCATTCVASETLGREWIGIDLSELAVKLVNQRLRDHHGLFGQVIHRKDVPKRTDLGELPNYRTHKHTLYGRQEGNCSGCMRHFDFRNLGVDHVVPQVKGGSHHIDNLQLLCPACNSTKGANEHAYLIARLRDQKIID